jgi:hypothetical protein
MPSVDEIYWVILGQIFVKDKSEGKMILTHGSMDI